MAFVIGDGSGGDEVIRFIRGQWQQPIAVAAPPTADSQLSCESIEVCHLSGFYETGVHEGKTWLATLVGNRLEHFRNTSGVTARLGASTVTNFTGPACLASGACYVAGAASGNRLFAGRRAKDGHLVGVTYFPRVAKWRGAGERIYSGFIGSISCAPPHTCVATLVYNVYKGKRPIEAVDMFTALRDGGWTRPRVLPHLNVTEQEDAWVMSIQCFRSGDCETVGTLGDTWKTQMFMLSFAALS